MTEIDPIRRARQLPNGARFYKCALQINPFEYLRRHHKPIPFPDEASYNQAIVEACKDQKIEIIAVTDHWRVSTSLLQMAKAAGLHVFRGFEATTKDGVHLLCLFDPGRKKEEIERIIGECGIRDTSADSPVGRYDVGETLERARDWNAVFVAAHVCSDKGLLTTLSGQSRINVWKSSYLLACSIPGPVAEAPQNFRDILQNKTTEYRRNNPIAILNAQDVNGPEDLKKPGASCWIKMAEVSVEGLRQAFLDPISRIRLANDPMPDEHVELVAIAWHGGFFDSQAIHFNENLNVLIGGRGAGKSTVIESLRYVLGLEPLGEDATKAHEGIIRHVLRSGTKISLVVRSYRPDRREYLIERTVPNPPVVRDEQGKVLGLSPQDIVNQVEIYGQHEISELTKSPEKLTRLLERFVEHDPDLQRRKGEFRRELERSRSQLSETRQEIQQIEERLAALPVLEETLKRFQEAGFEERLKEQSLLVREERILKTIPDRTGVFRELLEQLRRELPIDRTFLSEKALADLPGGEILKQGNEVLERLSTALVVAADQMAKALAHTDQEVDALNQQWEERKRVVQAAYEQILRELQKASVEGEQFISLRRQIEELRPLREHQRVLGRDLDELEQHRRNLLAEWEDLKGREFRQLDQAAKKVNRNLQNRVRVRVSFAGNREPLFVLLREQVGGRLAEAVEVLRRRDTLSLGELADALRKGRETVQQGFGIPLTQAEKLATASPDVVMQIEEQDLPPTTTIELNVAGEGQGEVWQLLEDLSTGQKATAVLLLLLLESSAPLVVDQPEDDLDNRFITDGIVPKMREEKRRRQFIFSTHNANIPVLGDAELIAGLRASGEAGQGQAEIPIEHLGAIDTPAVRDLVGELLEGGKEAFDMRRLKYGF